MDARQDTLCLPSIHSIRIKAHYIEWWWEHRRPIKTLACSYTRIMHMPTRHPPDKRRIRSEATPAPRFRAFVDAVSRVPRFQVKLTLLTQSHENASNWTEHTNLVRWWLCDRRIIHSFAQHHAHNTHVDAKSHNAWCIFAGKSASRRKAMAR